MVNRPRQLHGVQALVRDGQYHVVLGRDGQYHMALGGDGQYHLVKPEVTSPHFPLLLPPASTMKLPDVPSAALLASRLDAHFFLPLSQMPCGFESPYHPSSGSVVGSPAQREGMGIS